MRCRRFRTSVASLAGMEQQQPTEQELKNREILGKLAAAAGSPNSGVELRDNGRRPERREAPSSIGDLQRIAQEQKESRLGWWFQIPDDVLAESDEWEASGFGEAESWFKLVALKPREQAQALRLGKEDQASVGLEMLFQSLWAVGATLSAVGEDEDGAIQTELTFTGWYVRGNRDQAKKWWAAIGPIGRALVQDAFMDKHQPSGSQKATFLGSARRG